MPQQALTIRPATIDDASLVLSFIRQLAEYEQLLPELVADEDRLRKHLFGPNPCAEVLLAFLADEPAGFAVFFQNFSTFAGQPGIYLEDLFVRPEVRGRGIGRSLLAHIARIARERNCARLEWAALDWNKTAIRFYTALGAEAKSDWTIFRLAGESLNRLAGDG